MRYPKGNISQDCERPSITCHRKSPRFRTLAAANSKHNMDGHKMENSVTPRILKTKHAARYVGVSAWKLRNLVQAGEIPYIPGEGTSPWLFDLHDLDNWIERRKLTL
jgi:excisionase family DNA binding protein